ncbi:hypothetical protein RHAL1_01473 [Beijerinckiaceae bacterium RH AL1]|nr:hypothetical protein RHAL1_01473 [Beijerinckiaceae bacterium RH AL1]
MSAVADAGLCQCRGSPSPKGAKVGERRLRKGPLSALAEWPARRSASADTGRAQVFNRPIEAEAAAFCCGLACLSFSFTYGKSGSTAARRDSLPAHHCLERVRRRSEASAGRAKKTKMPIAVRRSMAIVASKRMAQVRRTVFRMAATAPSRSPWRTDMNVRSAAPSIIEIGNYIGGARAKAAGGRSQDVFNPPPAPSPAASTSPTPAPSMPPSRRRKPPFRRGRACRRSAAPG